MLAHQMGFLHFRWQQGLVPLALAIVAASCARSGRRPSTGAQSNVDLRVTAPVPRGVPSADDGGRAEEAAVPPSREEQRDAGAAASPAELATCNWGSAKRPEVAPFRADKSSPIDWTSVYQCCVLGRTTVLCQVTEASGHTPRPYIKLKLVGARLGESTAWFDVGLHVYHYKNMRYGGDTIAELAMIVVGDELTLRLKSGRCPTELAIRRAWSDASSGYLGRRYLEAVVEGGKTLCSAVGRYRIIATGLDRVEP